MTIAESLKRFRNDFKLTQKDVADKLQMSQQRYQAYEGKSIPSAATILKLATIYNVSADYLLGRIETPKSEKITPAEKKLLESVKNFITTLDK